ncbi:hypothetical protein CPAR01_15284 [Colletotrichum paranaense]|uniref:Uncharacterized protein n=1 Tax=Colletotrichum paranaense TaxID=1914294 RepID=A0ABQ9RZX9_9PEZI|nr:uncharacterized protein CPAR01_15284 [Colletotrichum paranaense]KAK1520233.1 hypothetical protein CPAR01_15284 [Colletotrichum paranaense]
MAGRLRDYVPAHPQVELHVAAGNAESPDDRNAALPPHSKGRRQKPSSEPNQTSLVSSSLRFIQPPSVFFPQPWVHDVDGSLQLACLLVTSHLFVPSLVPIFPTSSPHIPVDDAHANVHHASDLDALLNPLFSRAQPLYPARRLLVHSDWKPVPGPRFGQSLGNRAAPEASINIIIITPAIFDDHCGAPTESCAALLPGKSFARRPCSTVYVEKDGHPWHRLANWLTSQKV